MKLQKSHLEELKQQIMNASFQPSTVMIHPDTFMRILSDTPLRELYIMILKHGWKVYEQEEDDNGFTFMISHPDGLSITDRITLNYRNDEGENNGPNN